jgi:alpha-ketoglutarate-dependent taurine dioxygenase
MLIKKELDIHGFKYLQNKTTKDVQLLCHSLGKILLETDVKIDLTTKALVTSDKELDMHTDHSKAKYIIWHCLKQTNIGGHSLLMDTKKVLQKLSKTEKQELEKIQLFEHKIFKGDLESYPMLSKINGKTKMYYSFWFINPKNKDSKVFLKFKCIVDEMKKTEIRLNKNDVLIIDNDRMFHGRTKILGDKNRHLKRFWIF